MPSQMQGWNRSGPSQAVPETPRRLGLSKRAADSPNARRQQQQSPSPGKPKTFRGFENAFAPTTPVRSPTASRSGKTLRAKGKGRAIDDSFQSQAVAAFAPSQVMSDPYEDFSKHSSSPSHVDMEMGGLDDVGSSPSRAGRSQAPAERPDSSVNGDEDVEMEDDEQGSVLSDSNDDYPIRDWVQEVRVSFYVSLDTYRTWVLIIS